MVICGTLPTLQRFFRNVAPKLMGESKDGARGGPQKKSAGSTTLRTFGQGSNHKGHGYNKFGESDTEVAMTVLDTAEDDKYLRPDVDAEHRFVHVGTASADQGGQELMSRQARVSRPSHTLPCTLGSQEGGGIVQVTETIVKYD